MQNMLWIVTHRKEQFFISICTMFTKIAEGWW